MTLERIAPALFVILWSSGWIAPVYGKDHATALAFLSARFSLAALAFAAFAFLAQARWPRDPRHIGHALVSGMLMHGIYLGGVWWAIFHGVPASASGVIAALQPLLTAALAPVIVGERLSLRQKAGLVLGFCGIIIALLPTFGALNASTLSHSAVPIAINIFAMSGAVLGTLYQKRFLQTGDMKTTAVFQYIGALSVVFTLMLMVETPRFDFSPQIFGVLIWSVFVLSMGAVALLLYLIRKGQVSRAASLIYLVPPTVALQSWLFLGERIGLTMILGTVLAVLGVWLAGRSEPVART
jgi:drug/metabolite transporter (DMT)-like permease